MNDELKQAIADELNVEPQELTSDKCLADIETWDSVVVLSLLVILSEGVGKEITPVEMVQLKTFGDIERLVSSKLS
jgi:acyl carrier protein